MTAKGKLAVLFTLAMLCALAVCVTAEGPTPPPAAPQTQPAATGGVTVTVFCTGDIHEHTDGLARIAGYVKAAKAKDPNVLFLDAGDTVHQYGEKPLRASNGEAMWRLMQAAGYDAFVFGNHDHGMGRQRIIELKRMLPDLPLLAANIDWKKEPQDLSKLIPPYKIFPLQGVKVAVIGASSDELRYTRKDRFAVYYTQQAVLDLVPKLRKQADIIVAITHQYEDQDYALANHANAPDLIVGGHSHGGCAQPWGRAKNSYLLKAGRYSRCLGVVALKWDGSKIASKEGAVMGVQDDWPVDPQVKKMRDAYFEEYEKQEKAKDPAQKTG